MESKNYAEQVIGHSLLIFWEYDDWCLGKLCFTWQFFVTFLGLLSDPFKWLSDLQQGMKRSLWITWYMFFWKKADWWLLYQCPYQNPESTNGWKRKKMGNVGRWNSPDFLSGVWGRFQSFVDSGVYSKKSDERDIMPGIYQIQWHLDVPGI